MQKLNLDSLVWACAIRIYFRGEFYVSNKKKIGVHVYVSYKQSLIITKTMFVRCYDLLIYVYSNCCFCIEPQLLVYVPIISNDQVFRTIFIVVPTLGQLLVLIWNHHSIWKLFFIPHSCFCDLATFVEGTGRCFLTFADISEVFPTREPSS